MTKKRIIGKKNSLPWHIPEELQHFKKVTMGYPMIMGRRTFQSLPGLLFGRRHIVLTRNRGYKAKGADVVHSWQQAFTLCKDNSKVFIIGGEEIFSQALELADTILLTLVHREVEGDRVFPEFETNFSEVSRTEHAKGSEPFTVIRYEKKTSSSGAG